MYLTLIVAIVTSKYIFRCSKVSILIENIYISNQVKKSEGEPFDFISKFNLPILNALWNITAGCELYHY